MSGIGGFYVLTGTGDYTEPVESIVVNQSCIIDALEINEVDVLAAKGLSGVTLLPGMYLSTGDKEKITKISLASGSVILYF